MRYTTYKTAVNFLHNSFILCNDIVEIDDSIFENFRFDSETEIFQFYLTDCSLDDVKFLEKSFAGMFFSYSEKLDLYVLCVDFCGTSWDSVKVECTNDNIADVNL